MSTDDVVLGKKRKGITETVEETSKCRILSCEDETKKTIANAAQEAAARAAEIAKSLLGKSSTVNAAEAAPIPSAAPPTDPDALAKIVRAAELQRQLAAQIASVSSILSSVQSKLPAVEKKPQYRALRLDAQGREIDEYGNVVKTAVVRTLAANVAVDLAQKKKENPYLAHRAPPSVVPLPGTTPVGVDAALDERIITANRNARAKRGLKFVEAGKYVQKADELRLKEERKIIAGYASGRKAPEVILDESMKIRSESAAGDNDGDAGSSGIVESTSLNTLAPAASFVAQAVPPPVDPVGTIPAVEWWDEVFLPKDVREARKKSRAAAEKDDYPLAGFTAVRTCKYVQHPVVVKPLGGDRPEVPLPMYLTKKERKRIRKQAREEREREKRDKMMMGLIPAPEPKFKLSNFMKVLGDQAVADPSKVELRVLQQMRQRQLNHEMRNLSAKLTPAERKAKRLKKLNEDTSRQVHVAVFRIRDFSDPKHRFKVDVNAQQHFLSGTVVFIQRQDDETPFSGTNLVVVEGGPKGIRKFIKLMLKRIPWDTKVDYSTSTNQSTYDAWAEEQEQEEDEENEDHSDDDDDDEDEEGGSQEATGAAKRSNGAYQPPAGAGWRSEQASMDVTGAGEGGPVTIKNKCELLWTGIVAKRTFTGFKFQECRTAAVARKLLESKGVAQYWDMCAQGAPADNDEDVVLPIV